jgi:hypothetical protein
MANFREAAGLIERVRTPLSLAGLAFVILYFIYKNILQLDIYENVGSERTFLVIDRVVTSLFWLALAALILGIVGYLVRPLMPNLISPKPLQSRTSLIDASLDPQASEYTHDGDGVIRPKKSRKQKHDN